MISKLDTDRCSLVRFGPAKTNCSVLLLDFAFLILVSNSFLLLLARPLLLVAMHLFLVAYCLFWHF